MDKEKLINAIEDYLFHINEIGDEDEKWKKKAIVITPEMKRDSEVIVEDLTDDHDAYQRAIDDILGKVRKINDKLNED